MAGEYLAFLLRLQRGEGKIHWRATIQNAQTGEILRFANERDLIRYLMEVLIVAPLDVDSQDANHKNQD